MSLNWLMMTASTRMVVWNLPSPAVVESQAITRGWLTTWTGAKVGLAKTISGPRHKWSWKGANLEPWRRGLGGPPAAT